MCGAGLHVSARDLPSSEAGASSDVGRDRRRPRNMNYRQYNTFCRTLPSTTYVVQWGGSHVWKVGGKVFAIGGWDDGAEAHITFKVSDIAYEMLKEQPGLRPAPYLASRGMKWIQRQTSQSMDDAALKDYLRESHRLVVLKLTREARRQLGLAQIS
jgi:predicted DNA-binding protein (MmcQ/YjbR family)